MYMCMFIFIALQYEYFVHVVRIEFDWSEGFSIAYFFIDSVLGVLKRAIYIKKSHGHSSG